MKYIAYILIIATLNSCAIKKQVYISGVATLVGCVIIVKSIKFKEQ